MKTIPVILSLFLASTSFAIEEEIVQSDINNVTVYSQGAQIFRHASYSITKGVTKVIIEGVSKSIDANSLQVKANGNVIILDSKYSLYYPKPEEVKLEGLPLQIRKDIAVLKDSIENLDYVILFVNDEISVLNTAKSILKNNGAMRSQGKVNDSIPLLKEALEFYHEKMNEFNKSLAKLNRNVKTKNEELRAMKERLQQLLNHQKSTVNDLPKGPIPRITVTLKSSATARGELDVSYLVNNASWTPLYDLRSEIENGKVNLNYKAQVQQNTGIDWEDVPLTISTNNPYQNKTKPEFHPWYVDFNNYYSGKGYVNQNRINNMAAGAERKKSVEVTTAAPSSFSADIKAKRSDQFVTVVDRMISAEFKIDLPYTIQSNNEQHFVLIKNEDLKANYKYYTAPKLDKAAYLVAQISKLDELQLVPAKANIFFDGSYIGETYIDPTSLDDTLNLSLGKDPNIIVKRTLLKQECKEKVVGSNKVRTFAYQIEVKNLKSSPIEIMVQDQLPITQNGDIEIELLKSDKADVNETTGLMEWAVKLRSKQNEIIKFSYEVKHPKDKNLLL